MKTLKSLVRGQWHEADSGFADLVNPSTGEIVARASSAGIDFPAAYAFARDIGGPALRTLSVARRGALLKQVSKEIHQHREELIALSLMNSGATRKDAKFDLDGATGTLAYYASLSRDAGDARYVALDDGLQLGRTTRFWGRHLLVPRQGVAVHINAFNFPAWGFAEKAAQAILAGMPVITKPATSTAMVTERCIEIIQEAGILPEGVLSLICGSTGDLLSLLGGQDVLAFTGSADTALKLRSYPNLLGSNTRANLEADSLNAAVLGPGVDDDSDTWDLFLADVFREMTQKSGQKCTAVRRILVPQDRLAPVREALCDRLAGIVVGNPSDGSVNMGPLATADQLQDAVDGIALLRKSSELVFGTGERCDGIGAEPGTGFYMAPVLLEAGDPAGATVLHQHEVFGPVATLMPYDGSPQAASELVAMAGGTLVTSLYCDDQSFVESFTAGSGAYTGRLYLGSRKMADQAPGSGVALPQSLHGGPGRAGGGEELGGLRGIAIYSQPVAIQGSRPMVDKLCGEFHSR